MPPLPPILKAIQPGKVYALNVLASPDFNPTLLQNLLSTGSTTPVATASKVLSGTLPTRVKIIKDVGLAVTSDFPGKDFDQWIFIATPKVAMQLPQFARDGQSVVMATIVSAIEISQPAAAGPSVSGLGGRPGSRVGGHIGRGGGGGHHGGGGGHGGGHGGGRGWGGRGYGGWGYGYGPEITELSLLDSDELEEALERLVPTPTE
jgi:hypothetical protein